MNLHDVTAAATDRILDAAPDHGTPTMRGECCGFVFPDGARCIFGRHHEVKYHLHPQARSRSAVIDPAGGSL